MSWSNEIWVAVIIAFFIGSLVGYLGFAFSSASARKQQKLAQELDLAKTQIQTQKAQIEQHFEESAHLLATLAEDYKKLYTHLAQSSQTLLPDTNAKLDFFRQGQLEQKSKDNPPKDYTEGSSGILK